MTDNKLTCNNPEVNPAEQTPRSLKAFVLKRGIIATNIITMSDIAIRKIFGVYIQWKLIKKNIKIL